MLMKLLLICYAITLLVVCTVTHQATQNQHKLSSDCSKSIYITRSAKTGNISLDTLMCSCMQYQDIQFS